MRSMTRGQSILTATLTILVFIFVLAVMMRVLANPVTILNFEIRRSVVAGAAAGVSAIVVGEVMQRIMRWSNT